ncbi:MAG: hypothetical protein F6K24_08170 [Okeania sp. SIO2D1]|uniref:hypothetical protein n=1 Tax=Okeania sp. SIO2C9 TaxID=2607791 RepID=UPI0013BC7449|nr:hypothetical protein [Okeania sp. SIO2C9]NEQ72198.1 hypothetical protein [Okeania sp. SIO2C9]NES65230.1 hypothetical protein [Okeania sp. SIO2D1]
MGRWGDGGMGRWGDGEMGRWGDLRRESVDRIINIYCITGFYMITEMTLSPIQLWSNNIKLCLNQQVILMWKNSKLVKPNF